MKKILIIKSCFFCPNFTDFGLRCSLEDKDFGLDDKPISSIPKWCPLPDCPEGLE